MIAVLDYGVNKAEELLRVLDDLGHSYVVATEAIDVRMAKGIILTGDGTFGEGMTGLASSGLDHVVKEEFFSGKPILGINLGMQLFFTSSDEGGYHQGLNLLPGHVQKLEGDDVIHRGWNWLKFKHPHRLYKGLVEEKVYFSHTYVIDADNEDDVVGYTNYLEFIPAVVSRGNLVGMQFHPEKSGAYGAQLLDQFVTQFLHQGNRS
ncbi:imidazole glycerol phosphate synthase subunit HisH [Thermoactinomyces sp. DSM 45892]|uniref:imidazole glycerol phosphate synthase subunit HisH n=1 Tax=Thermoactinomyces sp. DSM 45892 TaxID=1882753 RepID=UPI00089A3613|nr:imidazole glycerol phosphate synthase subunit HisH [Thermoactinomyces sp. DSM 45892]SDZ34053.1 glutamine amidotransferase [Thermoactinomyces sp. DSM 45892]